MQLGVDWVSMGIFVVAYAISQVNSLALKLRYGILAVACGLIAVLRMRFGLAGINAVFTGFAAALAVYYVVKVFTARDRPQVSHGDDD